MKEILDKEIIDFKFSKSEYQKLINKIKTAIKENEKNIEEANQIDLKHYNKKIDLEKVSKILEDYRNDEIKNDEKVKKYLIEYNGNIYLTIQLCMFAILNKVQIILDINNFLQGLNIVLIKIINLELNKYGIDGLISICNLIDQEEIKENNKKLDKILCIDDMDLYNELQDYKIDNLELIKYNSIDLYCDDDDLVELRDMMCDYADNNQYQLEIYDDESKDEVANIIQKYGEGSIVTLLSNDKDLQEKFKNTITDKELYINKIPFDETKKINLK